MRPIALTLFALGPLVLCPPTADAGQLRMEFRNGTVSISAADVPLSQVLSEWARLGQTRIVNLEKVSGAPLTVELTNVPEKQALEVTAPERAGLSRSRSRGADRRRLAVRSDRRDAGHDSAGPTGHAAPRCHHHHPRPCPRRPFRRWAESSRIRTSRCRTQPSSQSRPEEQQPQLLAQPGIQPGPPVAAGQPGDGEEEQQQQQQQQRGPGVAPVQGVIIAPQPGQLPVPPRKPPEQ